VKARKFKDHIPGLAILHALTEDSRGRVYKAHDIAANREVFLRVFPPSFTKSTRFGKELEDAVSLAGDLRHPDILRVLRIGAHEEQYFVAMEYAPGYSLGEWLRRKGRLAEEDVLKLAESVASGLSHAWRHAAVCHGALSLDTIWVHRDGTIKVGDLLGVFWGACGAAALADTYRSPEQVDGKRIVDSRSDIYSLGAMMSHLLTGRHPLTGKPVAAAGEGGDASAPDRAVAPEPCTAISRLIERMTASAVEQRYQRWRHVLEDIRRVMAGSMPYAAVPETWTQRAAEGKERLPSGAAGGDGHVRVMRPSRRERPWYLRFLWVFAIGLLLTAVVLVHRELAKPACFVEVPAAPTDAVSMAELAPVAGQPRKRPVLPPRPAATAAPEVIPTPAVAEPVRRTPRARRDVPVIAPERAPDTVPAPVPAVVPGVPPAPTPEPAFPVEGFVDYLELARRVQEYARERRHEAAVAIATNWLAHNAKHPWRRRLEDDVICVRAAADLFLLPERRRARVRGTPVRASGDIIGRIESVEDGVLTVGWALADGNVRFRVPVRELSDGDFAGVLNAADPEAYPLHVARYLVASGDFSKALAWCAEAEEAGLDASDVREWAEWWMETDRNIRARAIIGLITDKTAAKRFKDAARSLRVLDSEFGDVALVVHVHKDLLTALRERVRDGLAGVEKPRPRDEGLPRLALSRLDLAETRERVLRTTREACTWGAWAEHHAAVNASLAALVESGVSLKSRSQVGQLTDSDTAAMLLGQSAFIRFVQPQLLARLAGTDSSGNVADFFCWLLTRTEAMTAFLASIKPEDDVERVLSLWGELWAGDPEGRDRYRDLALACALVFDRPSQGVDPHERYRFFRDSDRMRRLRVSLEKLPAYELVWVVDAPLSTAELEWAQKYVNMAQHQWERAYAMVPYRMERAVSGRRLYSEYTLENILRKGGICSDQAYFATMTAKANGIPAMTIVGEGQRGGHAWFGYKASTKEWNITAGRYNNDQYSAGTTRDPQTGRQLKEHELKIMADHQRRTRDYERATRLLWLGRLLADGGRKHEALTAYELALDRSSRHVDALLTYVEFLKQTDVDDETWERVIRRMKTDFRDYPDVIRLANATELACVMKTEGAAAAVENARRQTRRLAHRHGDRTDLIVENITRQIDLVLETGDTNAVNGIYYDALRDYGREVAAFKTLSRQYFGFASRTGTRHEALRRIDSLFRRYHPEPAGDYFRMLTYTGLTRMMAGFFDEDDQQSKAERLRRKADRIEERARERYD